MRGKKWVLRPHAVEVVGQKAKANLFEVPGGYVVPVTFGGKEPTATVVLRGLPQLAGQKGFRMEVIHPGEASRVGRGTKTHQEPGEVGLRSSTHPTDFTLDVPLLRGCAMVKLSYAWIEPAASWFCGTGSIQMGTTIEGGEIHYTMDGTVPTVASPR